MNDARPLKVLHVLGGMNRGGVETWLMAVLRHIDRNRFRMDIAVHTASPCAYDDEARRLGALILPCLHPSRPHLYARNFRRLLRDHGPYDVVHSHVHHYSGNVLRMACRGGVPARVAHSHNDTTTIDRAAGFGRRAYVGLMNLWIDRYATAGLAASRRAAASLFGPSWESDPRWRLLLYGLDFGPFHDACDPAEVRASLGIPEGAFVVGHVGRFVDQKNHAFLVAIASEVARREPRAHFLFIGEGELRPEIERRFEVAGLIGRVTFAGSRPDVPRLMLGAMDAFAFPSRHEGLGLVLVEAQAAGLPCVISDIVPEEADVIPPLMRRLSLDDPSSAWANALLSSHAAPRARATALDLVAESPFALRKTIEGLEACYDSPRPRPDGATRRAGARVRAIS